MTTHPDPGRGCRWIDGEPYRGPAAYTYCGAPRLDGSSWCAAHHRIVWVRVRLTPAMVEAAKGPRSMRLAR
jgi:hypothetical protein